MKACLYTNGTILTMESTLAAEAVLTVDGRIHRVGTLDEVRLDAPAGTKEVDLEHHVLLPAFIDPHSHITAYAHTLSLVQLEGAAGFDELLERIRAFREEKRLGPGDWISGFGYDHTALKEQAHPTAAFSTGPPRKTPSSSRTPRATWECSIRRRCRRLASPPIRPTRKGG